MSTDSPSFDDTIPGGGFAAPAAPLPAVAPDGWRDGRFGHPLRFSGRGEEYFKIWVVNLALTIVTLGIYSAWAKVRRLRYFYGNTSIADSTFDFHGSPAAILRGRIIALVVLAGYTFAPRFSLTLYGILAVVLLFGFPWLYWRSLRFRLGNTSYRGARFRFEGKVSTAYEIMLPPVVLFLAINLIAVFIGPRQGKVVTPQSMQTYFADIGALYLVALSVWPYYYHRLRAYQHNFARFGTTEFEYRGSPGAFYKLAGKMFLMALAWVIALSMMFGVIAALAYSGRNLGQVPKAFFGVVVFAIVAVIYGGLFALVPYASSRAQNIVWNNTLLGDATFTSELLFVKLLKIEIVNLLLTIVSLGLFRPFAAVRSARARIESLRFEGDPNRFEAAAIQDGSAVGYELGEMIGFDIAL